MTPVRVEAKQISKMYNRRTIFKEISFSLAHHDTLAIIGSNGAGKSTLSKIIAGIISATTGSLEYYVDDRKTDIEEFKHHIGFVSPYLNLYDEFTAKENLEILSSIGSLFSLANGTINESLDRVGLLSRKNDLVSTYSSGMKQRLKYAFALIHTPALLILDEPTSNLDENGITIVREIVRQQKDRGALIVATNDADEAQWCEKSIHVGN